MDLTRYVSTGGPFDSDDTAVTTQPVGTATLTYASSTDATFDYAFTSGELSGQSGTIALDGARRAADRLRSVEPTYKGSTLR